MNKFQTLDISANKAAKPFISDKYNSWLTNKVSKQLRAGKVAVDFKASLKLSVMRPLHAKWIVDLYNTLKDRMVSEVQGLLKLLRIPKKQLRIIPRKFNCKTCFFCKHMKQRHDLFFFSF